MKGSHQVIYKIWTGLLLLLQTLFQLFKNYICHSESQNPSHLNYYSENAPVLKISQLGAKNPHPGVLRDASFLIVLGCANIEWWKVWPILLRFHFSFMSSSQY